MLLFELGAKVCSLLAKVKTYGLKNMMTLESSWPLVFWPRCMCFEYLYLLNYDMYCTFLIR